MRISVDDLISKIRSVLDQRTRRAVQRDSLVPAAVLLPLLDRPQGVHVLFAKRSEDVPRHKGQMAFPGGVVSEGDASRLHTALREAHEEISLPADSVDILGSLDDVEAVATPFVITPFVGLIRNPFTYTPDGAEIERVIEVSLETLLDPATFRVEEWNLEGRHLQISLYDCHGDIIWGVTARILKQFLDLVFGEASR